ncbi:MAG: response regulator transcription factor [Acidimicrobiales bacterium]
MQADGSRAVIVDAWPMIRIGLARVLGSCGVRTVAEAPNANEALGYLRTGPVELLVIGDHGGVTSDVVRQAIGIRESLRVLVLLSGVTPDDLRALLGAGVSGVVSRAVGPDELGDAVGRVLGGERVVAPTLLPLLFEGGQGMSADAGAPATGPVLTAKEREVTRLLAGGASNAAIAQALFVSEATVKTHLSHIYAKLGAKGRHDAVARAVSLGIVA